MTALHVLLLYSPLLGSSYSPAVTLFFFLSLSGSRLSGLPRHSVRPSSQHGSHESYCYTTLLTVLASRVVSFILAGGDMARRKAPLLICTTFYVQSVHVTPGEGYYDTHLFLLGGSTHIHTARPCLLKSNTHLRE